MEGPACPNLDNVVWHFDEFVFFFFLEIEACVSLGHAFLDVCELAKTDAHFEM